MTTPFWDTADSADGGTTTAPGVEGSLYQSNGWDTCRLQGVRLPGLVQVLVPSKPRRVQRKKTNGADGETPTFRGLDAAKVIVNVLIWTPDQLSLWDSLLPVIFPNPNKDVNKLSALDISHPVAQQRNVKAIIVEDIDGPNDGPAKGSKVWSLKCIEYTPQKTNKSATKTVSGAVATTPSFQPSGKNTAVKPSQTDFGPTPAPTPQQGGT